MKAQSEAKLRVPFDELVDSLRVWVAGGHEPRASVLLLLGAVVGLALRHFSAAQLRELNVLRELLKEDAQ